MRILSLDYGAKTVGVAVTDPLGMTAQGVEIIRREKESHLRPTLRRIEELVRTYGAEKILLGYPLNMDDTAGERAKQTIAFQKMLEKRLSLPVFLWDERLTSVEAESIMAEAGIRREAQKQYVDMLAAQLILEDYLHHAEDAARRT